eukprot:SAG31_NODE_3106_length_4667_cov_27.525394_1_plen_170_part_00
MSAEIPDIAGEKDWGRYNMRGLKVDDVDMTHDSLDIEVASGVQLTLNQVHAKIGQFQWNFIKTKGFPKMSDKGKATAKISDTSMVINFDLGTDASGTLSIDNLLARVSIGLMECDITTGSNKWLYNKLLKVFATKIKVAVEKEMQTAVDSTVESLRVKIAETIGHFAMT